jgi:hypothetical protein
LDVDIESSPYNIQTGSDDRTGTVNVPRTNKPATLPSPSL